MASAPTEEVCLAEVFGAYMFTYVTQIEKLKVDFCNDFSTGYLSLLTYSSENGRKDFVFYEGSSFHPKDPFALPTPKEFSNRLFALFNPSKKMGKAAKEILPTLKACVELFSKFLKSSHPGYFLCDKVIRQIQGTFLEGTKPLPPTLEITLYNLRSFTHFVSACFSDKAGFQSETLLRVHAQVEKLATAKKDKFSLKSLRAVKKAILPGMKAMGDFFGILNANLAAIKAGTLTHADYFPTSSTPLEQPSFYKQQRQVKIMGDIHSMFLHDILAVLDTKLIKLQHPTLTSFSELLEKLNHNFASVRAHTLVPALTVATISPPFPLNSMQEALFNEITLTLQNDFSDLYATLWKEEGELAFNKVVLLSKSIHTTDTPSLYHNTMRLLPLLQKITEKSKLLAHFDTAIAALQKKHLSLLQAFLKTLDPKEFAAQKGVWGACLQTLLFISMDRALSLVLWFSQMENYALLEPENMEDEIHLISDAFADYISEATTVFDTFVPPAPIPVETPKPEEGKGEMPPAPTLPPEGKGEKPPAPAPKVPAKKVVSVKESSPEFSIKNRKKREVIAMLKERGFLHVSTKGSHMKFKHSEEDKTVIVPNHDEIKPGTLRSIDSQSK